MTHTDDQVLDSSHPGYKKLVRRCQAQAEKIKRLEAALERSGAALDVRKQKHDPWNPFSLKVARAKILSEAGESIRAIRAKTGLSKTTIQKIQRGEYDNRLPAATIEQARATETGKLTMMVGKCLDAVLEDESKIAGATLQQLATAAAIGIDKRNVLEGAPTGRIDIYVDMSEVQIQDEMRKVLVEMHRVAPGLTLDAEFSAVGVGQEYALPYEAESTAAAE